MAEPSYNYDVHLAAAGGLVYFTEPSYARLWRSDGTPAGTYPVMPDGTWAYNSLVTLGTAGDRLYFRADEQDGTGVELWTSDGTRQGTRVVKDIETRPRPNGNADPLCLVDAGGTLLFSATDGEHGRELWRTDGTEAGTQLVADLADGPAGSDPVPLAIVGGTAYFAATASSSGREIWSTQLPPVVVGRTVNGGAAQRSVVADLTVTFDRPVVPDAAAFALVGRAGAGAGATVSATNPSGDGRTWVLAFAEPGVVAGSLPDGVYNLTVRAAAVHAGGTAGPGMTADVVITFHRLFGDQDGNGTVNNADYVRFRIAFGSQVGTAAYNPLFDYNGNGVINNADYLQFRSRFGTRYTYA